MPASAALYRAVGWPVEALGEGLELHEIKHELTQGAQGASLTVSGTVVNTAQTEREVPTLRGRLRSDKGPIRHWDFTADAATLKPGESTGFHTTLPDPDPEAVDIVIDFTDAPPPLAP